MKSGSILPFPQWRRHVLAGGALLVVGVCLGLLFQACRTLPPRNPDDLCAIFAENRDWYRAARSSFERWGVPEPLLLAFLHQESRFRARAKPGWRKMLGFIPMGRLSSAYGYGQVKDGTWGDYQRQTGQHGAARDDFSDAVDFIGWYGDLIHQRTRIPKDDAYHLYLAYHEGPAGFERRSFDAKPWLLQVARKVEARTMLYGEQYAACPEPPRRSFWPF
jgi:hypothetical protein